MLGDDVGDGDGYLLKDDVRAGREGGVATADRDGGAALVVVGGGDVRI